MTSKSTKKLSLFRKTGWILITVGIFIRLFFYVSAAKTHTLNQFFLPVTQGQDFFQIPNGAYSFIRGGDLQGKIGNKKNLYTSCCAVNDNVYHPFFTLLVGLPLQLLKPWTAFNLWLFFHFASDILVTFFLIRNFRYHPLLPTAIFTFLASNFGYYEILNNQYHFLINIFTFFLLFELLKNCDSLKSGLYYFGGLLIKPVGILWTIPLLLAKYAKTIFFGVGLFGLFTLSFYFLPKTNYFFDNLQNVILRGNYPDWNIFLIPAQFVSLGKLIIPIKLLLVLLILAVSFRKKDKPVLAIMLWIIYSLMMYQSTYPYHYSLLPTIIPLLLLSNYLPKGILTKITLFFIIVPAPIIMAGSLNEANIHLGEKLIFIAWSNIGLVLLAVSCFLNEKNI